MTTAAAMVDWKDPGIWSPAAFAKLAWASDDRWAKLEPGPRVLVAAHDAGGAEVVGAWLQRRLARASAGEAARLSPTLHLAGPAVKVFERLGLVGAGLPSIQGSDAFAASDAWDWILTGTGWSTGHEKGVLREGITRGIQTSAYLDHWTNYPNRFVLSGSGGTIRPDHIWVGDIWAETLARSHFGGEASVLLVPNAYFAAIRAAYESSPIQRERGEVAAGGSGVRWLYVTEPISASAKAQHGDERWYGYTELEALEGFLDFIRGREGGIDRLAMRLRPHPSESQARYLPILNQHPFIHFSPEGGSLLEDCAWADRVVGCNSMAMVIGWLFGRRVYCSIPSSGPECALPLPSIERLFAPEMRRLGES
jgi:hypothetical protein